MLPYRLFFLLLSIFGNVYLLFFFCLILSFEVLKHYHSLLPFLRHTSACRTDAWITVSCCYCYLLIVTGRLTWRVEWCDLYHTATFCNGVTTSMDLWASWKRIKFLENARNECLERISDDMNDILFRFYSLSVLGEPVI